MRSRYRCSMCPAIHINSRSWLRSSSTHEPSDPPLRVISFALRERKVKAATPGQRTSARPEVTILCCTVRGENGAERRNGEGRTRLVGTPSPPGRGTEAAARLFKPSHDATRPQDGLLGPTRGQGADGAHQERRSGGRARSRDRYPTPKDFVFAADVPSGRRQATGPPTRVPGRPDSRDVVATLTTGGQRPRGPGSLNRGWVAANPSPRETPLSRGSSRSTWLWLMRPRLEASKKSSCRPYREPQP